MRDEDDQLYVYELYGVSTPRIIKATKDLRSKIGPNAGITKTQIDEAQEFIDNSGLDYAEQALGYIKQLEGIIEMLRHMPYNRESEYNNVCMPIMQIKGQAGMFGNKLATQISYIVLVFLEKFQRLDDNVLNIVDIYIKAIRLSYSKKLFTLDSDGGKEIADELNSALKRYQKRYVDSVNG
jgi:hypothetical protein